MSAMQTVYAAAACHLILLLFLSVVVIAEWAILFK